MFEFHTNVDKYFQMQQWVTASYVIPYVAEVTQGQKGLDVLEIGCAEAGVLAAFLEYGHQVTGIELSDSRAEKARSFLKAAISQGKARIINKNIYDVDPKRESDMQFDLIVLKDVIEHIPHQEEFIVHLMNFLKPKGNVFFAYPPWWMPFGGHQQICHSKILSKLPWFHLLPKGIYKSILNLFNEPQAVVDELLEIKATGITIERLKRILKDNNLKIVKETLWLTNPIYTKKFGIKPLRQWINIPYLRNIIATCHYVVFTKA